MNKIIEHYKIKKNFMINKNKFREKKISHALFCAFKVRRKKILLSLILIKSTTFRSIFDISWRDFGIITSLHEYITRNQ